MDVRKMCTRQVLGIDIVTMGLTITGNHIKEQHRN